MDEYRKLNAWMLNHSVYFHDEEFLAKNVSNLTGDRRNVFSRSPANLFRRALNPSDQERMPEDGDSKHTGEKSHSDAQESGSVIRKLSEGMTFFRCLYTNALSIGNKTNLNF